MPRGVALALGLHYASAFTLVLIIKTKALALIALEIVDAKCSIHLIVFLILRDIIPIISGLLSENIIFSFWNAIWACHL